MDFSSTPVKRRLLKDEVIIPASPFMARLGYGTGVGVYKFERSPKTNTVRSPWAVKKLCKKQLHQTEFSKRLKEEAEVLKKMDHPNIIGFRAFVHNQVGDDCLAMEQLDLSLGDLVEKRAEASQGPFPASNLMKVAEDIAKALDYLHETALLLHGDIKSYNVLIKGDFGICKLCDFGVSLPLLQSGALDVEKAGENARYIGTECWAPPEILEEPQIITSKADMFAFGLTLWEMISLQIPHSNDFSFTSEVTDDEVDDYGIRPTLPDCDLGTEYANPLEIFYCCTESDANIRLSAKNVLHCIELFRSQPKKE